MCPLYCLGTSEKPPTSEKILSWHILYGFYENP